VILGSTGVAMSVRGEQFWLDETRAAQLRPRRAPALHAHAQLDPERRQAVHGAGYARWRQPGTDHPAGVPQHRGILGRLYPNLHTAFAWPRFQTMHFYGSVWPHRAGFNRMNIEAPISKSVTDELKRRGHDVSEVRQYGISGCATGVMIDPATNNRLAGADASRDCYAMGY
jgi:gamma-glutamyltranspeptidase/glutathione hydrolase